MENNSKPIECYFTLGGINYKNGFITSCPQQHEKMVEMSTTMKKYIRLQVKTMNLWSC